MAANNAPGATSYYFEDTGANSSQDLDSGPGLMEIITARFPKTSLFIGISSALGFAIYGYINWNLHPIILILLSCVIGAFAWGFAIIAAATALGLYGVWEIGSFLISLL